MRINIFLALMVLFCAGCASFRQDEGVFQRIKRTSSIVQVHAQLEDRCEELRFSEKVGVVANDSEEIKWVINKMSTDRIIPLLPQSLWLADVVFLNEQEKPLALARLQADGHRFRLMPCRRNRNGYIVPVTRSTVHDFYTVDSREAWHYLYKHLPVINEEYFAALNAMYKFNIEPTSTNSLSISESIPILSPDSSYEVDAEQD